MEKTKPVKVIKINTIKDNLGARRGKKILGRGIGSGLGKTSGRGGKGQTARSGVALNGFEGGQNPIYRRLPKRGFVNIHAEKFLEIDFNKINNLVTKGLLKANDVLDKEFLYKNRIMPKHIKNISLIGNGKPSVALQYKVTRATKTANELVSQTGGSIVLE